MTSEFIAGIAVGAGACGVLHLAVFLYRFRGRRCEICGAPGFCYWTSFRIRKGVVSEERGIHLCLFHLEEHERMKQEAEATE